MNFHSVVPYLDLLIRNGLVEKVEGKIIRYKTTARGMLALGYFQEIEKLMPEMQVAREAAEPINIII
jgi:predicted transcriptional regulator